MLPSRNHSNRQRSEDTVGTHDDYVVSSPKASVSNPTNAASLPTPSFEDSNNVNEPVDITSSDVSYDDILNIVKDEDYAPKAVNIQTPNRGAVRPGQYSSTQTPRRPSTQPTSSTIADTLPIEDSGSLIDQDLDSMLSVTDRQNYDDNQIKTAADRKAEQAAKDYAEKRQKAKGRRLIIAIIAVAVVLTIGWFTSGPNVDTGTGDSESSAIALSGEDKTELKSLGVDFIEKSGNFGVDLDSLMKQENFRSTFYQYYQNYAQNGYTDIEAPYSDYVKPRGLVLKSLENADSSKKDSHSILSSDSPLISKPDYSTDAFKLSEFRINDGSIKMGNLNTRTVTRDALGRKMIMVPIEWTSTITKLNTIPSYGDNDGTVPKGCEYGCPGDAPNAKDVDSTKLDLSRLVFVDTGTNTITKNLKMYVTFVKQNDKYWQVYNVSDGDWGSYKFFLAVADKVSYNTAGDELQ